MYNFHFDFVFDLFVFHNQNPLLFGCEIKIFLCVFHTQISFFGCEMKVIFVGVSRSEFPEDYDPGNVN